MLPGCPIYGDDGSCSVDSDCPSDYLCDDLVGSCRPNLCTAPSDCPMNQTCSRAGTCVVGDCTWEDTGCVDGYVCSPRSGVWECTPASGAGGEGGAGGAAGVTGSGAVSGSNGGASG